MKLLTNNRRLNDESVHKFVAHFFPNSTFKANEAVKFESIREFNHMKSSSVISLLAAGGFMPGGGGDSPMKVTGMLVFSLRGVNCRFWSHLGCSGRKANTFTHTGIA